MWSRRFFGKSFCQVSPSLTASRARSLGHLLTAEGTLFIQLFIHLRASRYDRQAS
jgi:hypothetical protein